MDMCVFGMEFVGNVMCVLFGELIGIFVIV